jgi:hypothetical protein
MKASMVAGLGFGSTNGSGWNAHHASASARSMPPNFPANTDVLAGKINAVKTSSHKDRIEGFMNGFFYPLAHRFGERL